MRSRHTLFILLLAGIIGICSLGTQRTILADQLPTEPIRIRELEEKREIDKKYFQMSDGSEECVIYPGRVHFLDQKGKWEDISNNIVTEKNRKGNDEYKWRNEKNDFDVYFAEPQTSEFPVLIEKENASVSIGFENATKDAMVQVNDITIPSMLGGVIDADSSVLYKNVFPGTDILYSMQDNRLKEYLVINDVSASGRYGFWIKAEALTVMEKEGNTCFMNGDGKAVFEIEPLFAQDNKDRYTDKVTSKLVEKGKGLLYYEIEIDQNWLADAERAFPVFLDPTITVSGMYNTYDTYVSSRYPNNNFYEDSYMKTGRDADYYTRRSLLKFDLPTSIHYSQITSAYIRFKQYDGDTPTLKSYRVTSSWESSTATWNTKPSYTTSGVTSVTADGSNWFSLSAIQWTKGWMSNVYRNYGIYLIDTTESGTSHWARFYSSDHPQSSFRPQLVINYSPTTSYSASIMQGNTADEKDCLRFYNGLLQHGYLPIYTPGWGRLSSSVSFMRYDNQRVTQSEFIASGDRTISIYSGHGDNGYSGNYYPIINFIPSDPADNYGVSSPINVATALGVAGDNWQTACVWKNKPVKVFINAACSNLDINVIKYYARLMKASKIMAIAGYHQVAETNPTDEQMTAEFMSLSSQGYSILNAWKLANNTYGGQPWAVLTYMLYPYYQIPGYGDDPGSPSSSASICRYTMQGDSVYSEVISPTATMPGLENEMTASDGHSSREALPIYLRLSENEAVLQAVNELGISTTEMSDTDQDVPEMQTAAMALIQPILRNQNINSCVLKCGRVERDQVDENGVIPNTSVIVERTYAFYETFRGIPVKDSFIKISFDAEGASGIICTWKNLVPSSETMVVDSLDLERAKKTAQEYGYEGFEEATANLIYRRIDNDTCKLCIEVSGTNGSLFIDVESGKVIS